jgi:hypothetical protein
VGYTAVIDYSGFSELKAPGHATRTPSTTCDGVALAHVGKGNQSAAVLTECAIAEFNPAALLFVGVAGALHSHLALGDVVVATHVYAFHSGTSEDDGFKSRPRVWETSHAADQIARHIARSDSWTQGLSTRGHTPGVHAHAGRDGSRRSGGQGGGAGLDHQPVPILAPERVCQPSAPVSSGSPWPV